MTDYPIVAEGAYNNNEIVGSVLGDMAHINKISIQNYFQKKRHSNGHSKRHLFMPHVIILHEQIEPGTLTSGQSDI